MRRIFYTALLAVMMIFGGAQAASASTFDGTDMTPEFQTGITEVLATTGSVALTFPVYSMVPCTDDDIYTPVDCVWIGHKQGDGVGGSVIILASGWTADVSPWGAEILVSPDALAALPPVAPAPVPVETVAIKETYVEAPAPVYEAPAPVQAPANIPCAQEDSLGCYWDADTMGNGIGMDFIVDAAGNYTYTELDVYGFAH